MHLAEERHKTGDPIAPYLVDSCFRNYITA